MTRSRTSLAEHAPGADHGPQENGPNPRPTTRERIIRIAAELFARNGYHATGITEILDVVGLSRGTFYYHVDSKDSLLFEISRDQVNRMNDVADEIMRSKRLPTEKMRMLARSLVCNIAEHDAEWTVFFREFGALDGEQRQEILAARERYEAIWRKVLQSGAHSGEFLSVSPLHVKGILGMLNYSYLWINPNGELNAEQIADCFVDLLLEGLRPRGLPD